MIAKALALPRTSVPRKLRPAPCEAEPELRRSALSRHYYVFYYPLGPKQHLGSYSEPFDSLAEARAYMQRDMREFDPDRRSYKIRRVTPARFEKIWGRLSSR